MTAATSDATDVVLDVVGPEPPTFPDPDPPSFPDPPDAPDIGSLLCGSGLIPVVTIDGIDVTEQCVAGSWTPRLNRPAQATVTLPMTAWTGDVGSLLKISVSQGTMEQIVFHGPILNSAVDTDEDGGRIVYNAQDAMELWQHRPLRANDGDFTKPVGSGATDGSDLIATYKRAPLILAAALTNSESAGGGPPTDAEGPLGITITGVAGGGPILTGAPVDMPTTIDELFALYVSTGQLDAILTYVDLGGGITAELNLYNGNYGADRSADVRFEYGMGGFTAASVRKNRDMTDMCNKYWLYGGPSIETAADPKGEQHYCFNVQGFDPGLAYPPGGQSVDTSNNENFADDPNNPLGHLIYASRINYGVRMRIDIFDAYDDDCIPGFGTPGRELYRYQWQAYSWLAAQPRTVVHITPNADEYIGCFHIGDLVHVEAHPDVAGGFAGSQRVQQYTVSWEGTPSLLTLGEIQTSSDAEIGSTA